MKDSKSSAMQLVSLVWEHNHEATPRSWKRLNQSMRSAVILAIEAGMRFAPDDFREMYSTFRGGYWFGSGYGSAAGESFYNLACEMNNRSACISFERHAGRKPYIWNGSRVRVGSGIDYLGHHLRVTSITPEKITACQYRDGDSRLEVHRRFAITRDQLLAQRKQSPTLSEVACGPS